LQESSVNKVCLVAGEALTALGRDLDSLWKAVLLGQSAVKKVTRFPVAGCSSELAALMPELDDLPRELRVEKLLDDLMLHFPELPSDTEILIASTKAGVEELERARQQNRKAKSDLLFSLSYFENIARRFDLKQPPLNINAACASSTIALARGAAKIAHGESEVVFVCAYDVITEFIYCGFSSLKALSPEPSRPFDENRNGLNLGEGAVGLLLMSEERALKENRKILAEISGWGINNDAHHVTAPTRDGSGLTLAIEKALARSGVDKSRVAAISAHGTGTVHNDLMELKAFRNTFQERTLPIHSVKGAIGHTLGAAGGLEVLLCLKMLQDQTVPGSCGFSEAIEEVSGAVSASKQKISGSHILSTNSGFGGVNAALLISGATA
jgi:3-oxoacyl-[acyl-carrier-protein] synthase II